MLNAFTVDVEDYYQVSAFEQHISRDQWSQLESRVVSNTHRILTLLDRHDIKGTFFVLGWVAEHFPQLVTEIHDCGHEIGSHGFWHRLAYEQSTANFRDDLCRSRNVLQDLIGAPVTAHRAASFSITERSLWALDILVEEGFTVDSSIFPIHHDRYGIPDAEPRLHQMSLRGGRLWQFPPSVAHFWRVNLPVSGGGYFRLYPLAWTSYFLRRINRNQQPFMFYIHPWEIDPNQPKIPVHSRLSRFRHYVGLKNTERKLGRLLAQFQFGRIRDVIAERTAIATESALPGQAAVCSPPS
jgi:polysaccharide deacetylase family protein (PEP-CTERM system associated)